MSKIGLHLLFIKHYGRGLLRLFVCLALAIVVFLRAVFDFLFTHFFFLFIVETIFICIIGARAGIERWTLMALVDPAEAKRLSEKLSSLHKKRGTRKTDILIVLVFLAFVVGMVLFVYYNYKF